jgi:hypothetical protein
LAVKMDGLQMAGTANLGWMLVQLRRETFGMLVINGTPPGARTVKWLWRRLECGSSAREKAHFLDSRWWLDCCVFLQNAAEDLVVTCLLNFFEFLWFCLAFLSTGII